jgi:hypothetical protein
MARLLTWNATATVPEVLKEPLAMDSHAPNVQDEEPARFFNLFTMYGRYMSDHMYRTRLAADGPAAWWFVIPLHDGSGFLVRTEWVSKVAAPGGYELHLKSYAICDHEMSSKTVGRCYHRHECSKCGLVYHIDSGD